VVNVEIFEEGPTRPEGRKIEADEAGRGFLGQDPPHQLEGLGSAVSSPARLRGSVQFQQSGVCL